MTAPPLGAAGDFTISFVRAAPDRRRQRQARDLFYHQHRFQKLFKMEIQPKIGFFISMINVYYSKAGL